MFKSCTWHILSFLLLFHPFFYPLSCSPPHYLFLRKPAFHHETNFPFRGLTSSLKTRKLQITWQQRVVKHSLFKTLNFFYSWKIFSETRWINRFWYCKILPSSIACGCLKHKLDLLYVEVPVLKGENFGDITFSFTKCSKCYNCVRWAIVPALVVRRSDNAIHRINLYPMDNAIRFAITHPLDSDLSVV